MSRRWAGGGRSGQGRGGSSSRFSALLTTAILSRIIATKHKVRARVPDENAAWETKRHDEYVLVTAAGTII